MRSSATPVIQEAELCIVSEGTRIVGKIVFDQVARFHGTLVGEAHARDGSTLILCESSVIEGNILGDTIVVDGFVQGNIQARTRVVISGSGRVVGDIETPSLKLEFGSYFEGRCHAEPPKPKA